MKLIFTWVEEYKKIKSFQTNFGGKYAIKFNNEELLIEKNNQYIDDFFKVEDSDIKLSMSAIVGENGTGKSTILDFIVAYIESGFLDNNYIMIFEKSNKIYIDSNFDIKKINNLVQNLESVILKEESLDDVLGNTVTMFFSNVFDVRYFDSLILPDLEKNYRLKNSPKVINLSTNSLLSGYGDAKRLLKEDATKQIFFVNEYKEKLEINKLLDLPKKVYLVKNKLDINFESMSVDLESFILEFENEDVSVIYYNLAPQSSIKNGIISNLTINYCSKIAYILNKYKIDDVYIVDAYMDSRTNGNIIELISKEVIRKIKKWETLKSTQLKNIIKKIHYISEQHLTFLRFLEDVKIHKDGSGYYFLSDSLEGDAFIKFYREEFYSENLLSFNWSEMSSGQLSLLNLFGRFYSALYETIEDLEDDEENELDNNAINLIESVSTLNQLNYLLLIDECDLYFHPQWQKDWLFYFIKLIGVLFKGNVQVILTTHSPFILSDFPNSNVSFLSGNPNRPLLNGELEGSVRTFGANINELFTNSFFISDGLMGKFAKDKINKFIRDLLDSKPDDIDKDKDKYKSFIDIIGEPLIKNKLLQIYNEKIALASNSSIEDRIRYLEMELSKIKNRSDKND